MVDGACLVGGAASSFRTRSSKLPSVIRDMMTSTLSLWLTRLQAAIAGYLISPALQTHAL